MEEKKIIRESTENNKTQNNQTLQDDTTFYDVYSGFKKEDLMDSQIGDRVLGCSKAPHTIIEYSSFSCPHCADYHESVWPRVKAELIDTCKVRYIYRDFPTTGSSAFASLVAYCLTQNDTGAENYYKLLDTFFISQRSWVFSGDYQDKILQIIKLNGFAEKQFNVCTENKNMANMILARAFVSQDKLNINYTPTIFIDGEKIDDMLDFASISKALNSDKKTNK